MTFEKENEMDTKTEGTLAVIAALLVLFGAMLAPPVSVGISLVALLGFGLYKLAQKKGV
jgi:hypothetical protein